MVWEGAELGIAPSPLKGNAALQNVNINTETGEAMASFARFKQDQVNITNGTLTASVSDGAVLLDAPATLQAGQWITVSNSTIPSATASANYLVLGGGGGGGGAETSEASGGGGSGGLLTGSKTFPVGAHVVTVGDGGAGGATGDAGSDGELSKIGTAADQNFWALIVAGAAGGGTSAGSGGGGGGAGGMIDDSTFPMPSGIYSIIVGAGGAASTNGSDSSIGSLATATGGGAGGGTAGSNGGSGGGGAGTSGTGTNAGGTGTVGQGNNGGSGIRSNTSAEQYGGGGGGAGGAGGNATNASVGAAGLGLSSSITGSPVTYAAGGLGGEASGGSTPGGNGAANTGNAGGGGNDGGTGGTGGSGVVILRFPTAAITVHDSTGASSSTSGSDTILRWTTSGIFSFSIVGEIVAFGGGGGGTSQAFPNNGGSGGGGGTSTFVAGGQGTTGQGNDGGNGDEGGGLNEAGGGGGGAGAIGGNGVTSDGGAGGAGVSSSISGVSITYGGGGGGGGLGSGGSGGSGGGGNGLAGDPPTSSSVGINGLGGGGGGNAGENAGSRGGSGIVIISYVTGSMSATGGAITFAGGNTIHTFTTDGTFTVQSIATAGQYFVSYKNSSNKIKLSAIFDPYGLYPIVHGTTGTATFSILAITSQGLSKATEKYSTATDQENRYYILDDNGYVWVYDTQVFEYTLANNGIGEAWMLPDPTDYSAEEFNSITILNGWLTVLNNSELQGKPTTDLGGVFEVLKNDGVDLQLINPFPTHINYAFVGHQGKLHYCDGNYIGELFPTTSLATSTTNTQTYARITGTGTTATIVELLSGSTPFALSGTGSLVRIPIVFFAGTAGSVPAGITEGVVYYAQLSTTNNREFEVYTTATSGSAMTVTVVGNGTYINTFYPLGQQDNTAGTHIPLFQFSPQRLNLPTFETATCIVEVGNSVLIGGTTNTMYPWNQISALPTGIIALPESGVKAMTNVNNMAIVLAGNKGNVYISNTSTASLLLKIPDYCAGIPGSPNTYIEPRFTWGDVEYLRGRVYLSILDQTSTKAGNCGGVWSFVPTQNFFYGQDTGLALRLENQNSYGNYNGMATLIIGAQDQNVIAPQYWTSWQNSYTAGTSTAFGIDQTDDIPVTTYVIETDLVHIGTFLSKTTLQHFEYALTTPFASGDSIALFARKTSTAAWTALDGQQTTVGDVSGYYTTNYENAQWLQVRAEVTTNGTNTSSFSRVQNLRVH